MGGILRWIRSIVFYLILAAVLMNMLPDKKYEKYLRLFVGMVLIFLVFEPFTDLSGFEAQVAGAFERITFQNDASLLKREIADMDGRRMERLTDGYEEAIQTDIMNMAETSKLRCRNVQVVLERDMESGSFGRVLEVSVVLELKAEEQKRTDANAVSVSAQRGQRREANREMAELKKRIGEYYGLEEAYIALYLESE